MSIRAIAQDLYKCQSRVHQLEDQFAKADYSQQESIKEELRQVRAELKTLKNMIEGRKAQSSIGKKDFPFSLKR